MSELIDNRARRIQALKSIILELHTGASPGDVRENLKNLVGETSSAEIAAMEQELMADGMAVEEVKGMCDLHAEVLSDILVEPQAEELSPGHPLETLRRENDALAEVLRDARALLEGDQPPGAWRDVLAQLMDVEKHYQRKENLLFSCLERHGITGPSKVMWAKDDEVRELIGALDESTHLDAISEDERHLLVETVARPALDAVEEMIRKETVVLFPLAQETLTDEEWGEVWRESPRFGYCLVQPGEGYQPPDAEPADETLSANSGDAIVFETGALDHAQLEALFAVLPVDLTFIDADDRVSYFSEGPDRVFARSRAIIGRKVQHCHPPNSVHIVEEIVGAFRSGARDVAEFWIEHGGRFVHIRYFAVRGAERAYLGTLEVTQDLTRLRALPGERRLLEWEGTSA